MGRHNHFSRTDKSQVKQTSCLLTAALLILYGFGETRIENGALKGKRKRNDVSCIICWGSAEHEVARRTRNTKKKHLEGIRVSTPSCVVINRKRKLQEFVEPYEAYTRRGR